MKKPGQHIPRSLTSTAIAAAIICAASSTIALGERPQKPVAALSPSKNAPRDAAYIRGYAAAILEREFGLFADEMVVSGDEVRLPNRGFGTLEKQQLIKSLLAVPGVKRVTIVDGGSGRGVTSDTDGQVRPVTDIDSADPAAGGTGVARLPGPSSSESLSSAPSSPGGGSEPGRETPLTLYLSVGRLFEPLVADPRWPHFYASYNYYKEDAGAGFTHVGSVGFGETISIIRKSYENGLRWEAGVQAGVFAIFDLGADSKDLINADYFVGPYAAFRYNDFSLLTRVFHQSSHLGDEYLLRDNGVDRVNVSYEAVDLIASYELPYGFRVYGGAGYLFDQEPDDIDPWTVQYGAEWRSPTLIGGTSLRPIAAVDIQQREESDWNVDYSVRAGVQFEDPGRFSQRMSLMLEYYDGRSPNGQFYDERIQFYGLGLHFYF